MLKAFLYLKAFSIGQIYNNLQKYTSYFKKYFLYLGMQIWKQLKNTLMNNGSLTSHTING